MINWTDNKHAYLMQLKNEGYTVQEIANKLSEKFNQPFTYDGVRSRLRRKTEHIHAPKEEKQETPHKETVEILKDGLQRSDKPLKMSEQQSKDTTYLLDAHGYDPDKWEVVTAKNSMWNQHNKKDGTVTLYSSNITVKPKENGFDWVELLKKIETIPSKRIEPKYITDIGYLNIPLYDMHFGISDYEYYKPTQREILGLIEKGYKEVLFIVGQDLLHNNNFKGTTANGTVIDKVDMEQAWENAMLFYIPLIEKALEKCKKVKIIYSKGNHDESMSWAFVQCLKTRFPQADTDTRFKERKVHMLGTNFIGINHGEKKKETDLNENFSTEFPMEWARATTREILTGHRHTERVVDKGGAVLRRMPTRNKIDGYHDDHGYTTAHKRFEVLEYSEDAVKRIHYV